MIRFIDRESEMDLLERAWNSRQSELIVLYGRRRVGKSRLLQEFLKDKDGIYHKAGDASSTIQMTERDECT